MLGVNGILTQPRSSCEGHRPCSLKYLDTAIVGGAKVKKLLWILKKKTDSKNQDSSVSPKR